MESRIAELEREVAKLKDQQERTGARLLKLRKEYDQAYLTICGVGFFVGLYYGYFPWWGLAILLGVTAFQCLRIQRALT